MLQALVHAECETLTAVASKPFTTENATSVTDKKMKTKQDKRPWKKMNKNERVLLQASKAQARQQVAQQAAAEAQAAAQRAKQQTPTRHIACKDEVGSASLGIYKFNLNMLSGIKTLVHMHVIGLKSNPHATQPRPRV